MNVSLTPEACAALTRPALIELAWTSAAFGADGEAAKLLSMAGPRGLPDRLEVDASSLPDIAPARLPRALRQMGVAWGQRWLVGRDRAAASSLISNGPWSRGMPTEFAEGFIDGAGREAIIDSFGSFVAGNKGFWAYMLPALSQGFHFFPEWDLLAIDAFLAWPVDERAHVQRPPWHQPWALGVVDVDDVALASRLFAALVSRGGDLSAVLSAPSRRSHGEDEDAQSHLGALAKAIHTNNQPLANLMVDMCPSIDVDKAIADVKKMVNLLVGMAPKQSIPHILAESDAMLALGESLLLRRMTPDLASAGASSPRLRL